MFMPRLLLPGLVALMMLAPVAGPAWAADPHTKEAIRQMEEGLHAVRPAPAYPWGYPGAGPWWGWSYPPAYPPPQPYPPYGAYPPSAYPPPQESQSPYPARVNPAGRLLILVNPVDAEVYVDGVRLQQRQDLSYEVGLLAGPHQLDVRKDGYRPFSKRLDVLPGGGMYLPVALEK